MFSHHVVTIFLITGSILTNMSAVGCVSPLHIATACADVGRPPLRARTST
jgi:hypothetical protein